MRFFSELRKYYSQQLNKTYPTNAGDKERKDRRRARELPQRVFARIHGRETMGAAEAVREYFTLSREKIVRSLKLVPRNAR